MLCCLTAGHPSREDMPTATRGTSSSLAFACGAVGGGLEVVYGSRVQAHRLEKSCETLALGLTDEDSSFSFSVSVYLCLSPLAALLHTEPNVCCVFSSLETLHTAGAEHLTAISTSHTLASVCVCEWCVRLCVLV